MISKHYHNLSSSNPIIISRGKFLKKQDTLFDMHYELEVGIVLSGCMQRHFETWKTNLKKGMVWLCGMWEPHGYKIVKVPCEVLVFVIMPEVLTAPEIPPYNWIQPFINPSRLRPQTNAENRNEILRIASQFLEVMNLKNNDQAVWIKVLLFELLLTLQKNWQSSVAQETIKPSLYQRIQPALRMIFDGKRGLTVQKAAQICSMSRNTFAKHFKTAIGVSFSDFATRFRLKRAAYEILNTNSPLKAIAVNWGFTDISHLHKCFLKHYGCSPSEYRKKANFQNLP